jgi:phosphoglucosamine mutase
VRGKAGAYPLDPPTVRRLGAALVRVLRHDGSGDRLSGPLRFLSGRDTRESGSWIEQELAAGMVGEGPHSSAPAWCRRRRIAYLTPRQGFTAGVVISASHNPFGDNGIKVFSGAGEKFTEVLERRVESMMDDASWSVSPESGRGAGCGLSRGVRTAPGRNPCRRCTVAPG